MAKQDTRRRLPSELHSNPKFYAISNEHQKDVGRAVAPTGTFQHDSQEPRRGGEASRPRRQGTEGGGSSGEVWSLREGGDRP